MTHVGHELSKLTIRRFLLRRDKDVSGVSGLGHVAEGIVFTDGTTILRWRAGTPTTNIFESPEAVERVHGHYGGSTIEWLDDGLDTKPTLATIPVVADPDVEPGTIEIRQDGELIAWRNAQDALGIDPDAQGLPIVEPTPEETSAGVKAAALSIVLAGILVLAYAALTVLADLLGWLL